MRGRGGAAPLAGAGLLWAVPAAADVPFVFVAATLKVAVWWTIPATLLIETLALRALFALDWRRAALASLVVNAASAALGTAIDMALLGGLYAALMAPVSALSAGAQGGLVLLALWLVVTPVDTAIELLALRLVWRLRASARQWLGFGLVNLLTVGLCVGALAWDMFPRPASAAEQARIEQFYATEIAWMRELLNGWPQHVGTGADGRLETERAFARACGDEARRQRFAALSFRGPAGAFYPVARSNEHYRWQVVQRSRHGDVVFERWEGQADEWLGSWRARPPPRFGYEIFIDRPDGRWRVEAMFDADPAAPAEGPPAR